MFQLTSQLAVRLEPNSFVTGSIDDQMIDFDQFLDWVDSSFQTPSGKNLYSLVIKNGNNFSLKAQSLRDGTPFEIVIQNNEQQNSSLIRINTT